MSLANARLLLLHGRRGTVANSSVSFALLVPKPLYSTLTIDMLLFLHDPLTYVDGRVAATSG